MGFFDWLRSDENTIIGIRICFFDYQIINPILKQCANAKISNDEKYIELLFAGKEYDPTLSGDQDFTNNYIYKSNEDDYLFTFGLDHLTENELKSLLNYSETLIEDDIEGIPLTWEVYSKTNNMEIIEWLPNRFAQQCNGVWEYNQGIGFKI